MKRVFAAALALSLLFLTACGASQQTDAQTQTQAAVPETKEAGAQYMEFNRLPEIGTRGKGAARGRYYNEFRDSFQPQKDYGRIVPFIGNTYYFKDNPYLEDDKNKTPQFRYGMMTDDGRIVVDDVFAQVRFLPDEGACGVYWAQPFAKRGAQSMRIESADSEKDWVRITKQTPDKPNCWYISADGTWAFQVPHDHAAAFGQKLVAVYPSAEYSTESKDCTVRVFDYSGKQRFTVESKHKGEVSVQVLSGDLVMSEVVYKSGSSKKKAYTFTSSSGKQQLKQYQSALDCTLFGEYLIVKTGKDAYSLIDLSGKERIKSNYMHVETLWETPYLITKKDKEFLIMDTNLNAVGTPKKFHPYLTIVNGVRAYSDSPYPDEGKYWRMDSDAALKAPKDFASTYYIDGRYALVENDDNSVSIREIKTGQETARIPDANAEEVYAGRRVLYLSGNAEGKARREYLYNIKTQRMLFEKEIINCYEIGNILYLTYYGNGTSEVVNCMSGEKLYYKYME
ncbi:MAG: hypothetical protein IJT44_04750 [Clostridia bacterium]|nr:hypothetical protein [Clostridia bacterium]